MAVLARQHFLSQERVLTAAAAPQVRALEPLGSWNPWGPGTPEVLEPCSHDECLRL